MTTQAEQQREKLELTGQDARYILWEEKSDEYEIVRKELTDTSRWSVHYELIIKRKSDGKLFRDYYSVGATESQDEQPWEYDEPNFIEVFPVEKTVIVYE